MGDEAEGFKKYQAGYTVEAMPMTVGEYCRDHWTTDLSEQKRQQPGFFIRYPFINPETQDFYIGWMSQDLFWLLFSECSV